MNFFCENEWIKIKENWKKLSKEFTKMTFTVIYVFNATKTIEKFLLFNLILLLWLICWRNQFFLCYSQRLVCVCYFGRLKHWNLLEAVILCCVIFLILWLLKLFQNRNIISDFVWCIGLLSWMWRPIIFNILKIPSIFSLQLIWIDHLENSLDVWLINK